MTTANHVHEPWDEGAIDAALQSVFGPRSTRENVGQKTVKTMCGKRVGLKSAVHGQATCPDCLTKMAENEAGRAAIEAYMESVR